MTEYYLMCVMANPDLQIEETTEFTNEQYFTPKSIEQDLYFCVYVYHFNNGVIDGGPYRVWHRWGSGDGNQKIACISNSEKFGIYNRNINLFIGKVNDLFLLKEYFYVLT